MVPSSIPSQPYIDNTLSGVAADTASDVWAVGQVGGGQTLIEHWNGSSWSTVTSPNPGSEDQLNSVAVVSASDVWAVGQYVNVNSGAFQTLIEHWNGSIWSKVTSPNPGSAHNQLNSVAVVSANDIWAVGLYGNGNSGALQTLAEHYDGTSWSKVTIPNPGSGDNALTGVAAVSTHDVWAVGYSTVGMGNGGAFIDHWNGSSWSTMTSPNYGSGDSVLSGVAAVSTHEVWAVGSYSASTGPNAGVNKSLIELWNGTSWSIVPSPIAVEDNVLLGVADALPFTDVWAVGWSSDGPGLTSTLTLNYAAPL
jgi:hypothetical protein